MTTCGRLRWALIALLGLALFRPAANAQVNDWQQISIPPLPAFHPQEPRRVELPNGMVVFLQEDHELPLIRGTARIRGGSRDEPAAKAGLVEIYGDVWRTGGTKTRTGDELDDYLEARAAHVETGDGLDSTSISWDCLKENFDEVFKVFVELLRDPAFREDKLGLAKTQLNTSIARRNDDPAGIARREAAKLAYGAASPYARQTEYATVAAVTRDDLVNWHERHVHPNNIILGVVGDFDPKTMEQRLRAAFEAWPKGPTPTPAQVSFPGPKPGIYFVNKEDVNQTNVRMVDLGTRRDNPDFYAIEVLNEIFGGSFTSRLVQHVRTQEGLAYAVGGGVGAAFDHPGLLQISLGTKSGTTAAAIEALDKEIDGLKTNPPTVEELKKAKDSILNSFVFRFDSKAKVLQERMAYEFYAYPADFLERYRAGIEKVTQAGVERVAQKYIHKDRLAVLVVGKASDFDRPLSTLGQVTTLDVSIPGAAAAGKRPTVSSNPEGRTLLAKVVEGLGGAERVRTLKSLREKGKIQTQTPQGEMLIDAEQVTVFPDRLWQKLTTPMGEMTIVFSPAASYVQGPMGTQDLPASQKEQVSDELQRDPFFIVQRADDAHYTFSAGGSEKVGEVETQILDVKAGRTEVRWFVDPQSGRILRASTQETGREGPTELVIDYADWKTVEGLTIPFKETRTRGGEKQSSVALQEVEINPPVDAKLFEKAAEKPAQP